MPRFRQQVVPPVYEVALRCQTVAGSGRIGATDGAAEVSTFSFPTHVLPLADGSALVSDTGNDSVRHVSIDGRGGYSVRKVSLQGFTWMRPRGMAQLPDGGVLVCDSGHNRIRLLGADGGVSVYAGSGRRGRADGPALQATFDNPTAVCVCADGSVLVCDTGNHCIRTIVAIWDASGTGGQRRIIGTLAGSGRPGSADGPAHAACFDQPCGIVALGNVSGLQDGESVVYVADSGNHAIRLVTRTPGSGELSVGTLCGKPGLPGNTDGALSDGTLATPAGLAVLPDGSLVISDAANNNLRRVDFQTRTLGTLGGSTERTWGLVDGMSHDARFNVPKGLSVAPSGDVWLADSQNHCVRVLRAEESAKQATRPQPPPMPLPAAAWTDPVGGDERRGVGPLAKAAAERRHSGEAFKSGPRTAVPAPGPYGAPPLPPSATGPADDGHENASEAAPASVGDFQPRDFSAEAQLFERTRPPKTPMSRPISGGWTYTGTAQVTLRRCAPRAAMLAVQVHGAATAEVSVVRPGQLMLRDTAFVVCTPDADSGGGFNGFGSNELGLRFTTTTAAASLLAACEAIVGEAANGHGGDGPPGTFDDSDHPPHGPPHGGLTPNVTPGSTPARPTRGGLQHPAAQQRASCAPSTFHTASRSLPGVSEFGAPQSAAGYRTAQTSTSGASPPRTSPRKGTTPGGGGAPRSALDPPSAIDQRLHQADQEILRLSALLAERDMEAGRLLKRLEQAQLAVRARDSKVAELQRRLNLLSAK
jgi:hypothetical protein